MVHHLLLVENSITGYVQKKLLAAEQLAKPNLHTRPRMLLVRLLRLQFEAPRRVAKLTHEAPVPALPDL